MLDGVIKSRKDKTEIEIWLDSPGGDAHATYKLLLDLRHRCQKLTVIVPDYAKSAATLLCLGADEIFMAPAAELGPLDVQILHPDRETQPLSGLDVAGSFSYLSEFALQLILTGGAAIREATNLPRTEVLEIMHKFTAQFLRPCMDKIDPHVARRVFYQLKVAERYATAMLEMRNVPDPLRLKGDAGKKVVHRLVHDYPVHEFVIGRDEAKKLGLPIFPAESHENWLIVRTLYEKFSDGTSSMIRVLDEAKEKAAVVAALYDAASLARVQGKKIKSGAHNGPSKKNNRNSGMQKAANGKVADTASAARRSRRPDDSGSAKASGGTGDAAVEGRPRTSGTSAGNTQRRRRNRGRGIAKSD
ncbi:MAG TPA: hypothetical protein VIM11_24540 [Tepidisphaeraceae bacterium]